MKSLRSLSPLLLLSLASAPLFAQAHDQGTSKESAYYTYQQQEGEVLLMVDSQVAYYSAGEPFVPFHVAVALYKGSPIKFALESFRLTDSSGKQSAPASLADIQQNYRRLEEDKNLMMEQPLNTGEQFSTLRQVSAAFYPVTQSPRLATEGVELPASTWWQDTIYFPMPSSGLDGVLQITFEAEGMQGPVTVSFRVPEKKAKDKDKKDKERR